MFIQNYSLHNFHLWACLCYTHDEWKTILDCIIKHMCVQWKALIWFILILFPSTKTYKNHIPDFLTFPLSHSHRLISRHNQSLTRINNVRRRMEGRKDKTFIIFVGRKSKENSNVPKRGEKKPIIKSNQSADQCACRMYTAHRGKSRFTKWVEEKNKSTEREIKKATKRSKYQISRQCPFPTLPP